jgi:excisionase family DNA binding protein
MNTNEIRRWLMRKSEQLKAAGEHPEPDAVLFEDAGEIVDQAKQLALDHHFPEAYKVASDVRSGPMAIGLARSVLSVMLRALPKGDDVLTVADVAAELSVDQKTIYALCNSGKLTHVRIGEGRGTIRITRADLERFLEESRSQSEGIADFLA